MGEQTVETQVAVIGGGPGGYAAAFRAADLGLDVTLINAEKKLGGVCLKRGCIPSKAFLEISELVEKARQAQDWGVTFENLHLDPEKMHQWKNKVVEDLVNGLGQLSKKRDINLIEGLAVFESSNELRIEGAEIAHVKFEHAILASGAEPVPMPGMEEFKEDSRIMDSRTALELTEVPETLLVIGGGYIGLELGSVYSTLGSKVSVVEMTEGLLPGTDRELVEIFSKKAEEEFEAIYTATKVTELKENKKSVSVTFEGGVDEKEQKFDRVLVAIGRRPKSDNLGLENTDVKVDDSGFVQVDEHRRTDDKNIFAVGDVVGEPLLAHKAMHEGNIAAEVIAGEPAAFDVRCIPSVIYTHPEIAWCGLTEKEAKEKGHAVKVGRFPWKASGRALTMGAANGLTKMVFDAETERVLGVGIVGRHAENLIIEGALAMEMGAVARDLASTIHPHPTLSETGGEAADAFLGLATHLFKTGKEKNA